MIHGNENPRVFLSCAGISHSWAQFLAAALRGMRCEVFYYWQGPSTDPQPMHHGTDRFEKGAADADVFVQLVQEGLGWTPPGRNKAILELELEWYLESRDRQRAKPPPLIVSLRNPSLPAATRTYLDALGNRWLDPKLVLDEREATETVVGWMQGLQQPPDSQIVHGIFDATLVGKTIDQEVNEAIIHSHVFPQKYLYTSPVGGMLWKRLKSPDTAVGAAWERMPFRNKTDKVPKRILDQLSAKSPRALSIMALGCGDGEREAAMAGRLREWHEAESVHVLAVDASKTLLGEACKQFINELRPVASVHFALVDFERPGVLSTLRSELPVDEPCIVMFLGNTLGNIAIDQFIGYLSAAMRPKDVLVLEIRIASDVELEFSRRKDVETMPIGDDVRFEFISNPIRFFGLTPRRKQCRYSIQSTRFGCRKTYEYEFNEADQKDVQGTAFASQIRKKQLLRLVNIESFEASRIVDCLKGRGFTVIDEAVDDGLPTRAVDEKALVRMGFIVAVKTEAEPQ